jgi:hypothetical protein
MTGGSASALELSRPARASLCYGPSDRSAARGRLRRRAPAQPVTRPCRLPAARIVGQREQPAAELGADVHAGLDTPEAQAIPVSAATIMGVSPEAPSPEVAARIASNSAPPDCRNIDQYQARFFFVGLLFRAFSPTPKLDMTPYVAALSDHASIGRVIS